MVVIARERYLSATAALPWRCGERSNSQSVMIGECARKHRVGMVQSSLLGEFVYFSSLLNYIGLFRYFLFILYALMLYDLFLVRTNFELYLW